MRRGNVGRRNAFAGYHQGVDAPQVLVALLRGPGAPKLGKEYGEKLQS